jgi:hypothetical protein
MTFQQVTDGNALSSSYVIVQARAGRIRAMLQSLRYASVRVVFFLLSSVIHCCALVAAISPEYCRHSRKHRQFWNAHP